MNFRKDERKIARYRGDNCEEIFIDDMKYISTKDFYHKFYIQYDNRLLKGCSGAPILDKYGNLVSLIVKRDKKNKKIVYGIDLKKVSISLHMEINNITGEEIYE